VQHVEPPLIYLSSHSDIEEIGLSSARLANLAGRSEVNAVDAHVALEDLGVDLTFLQQYIRQADDSGFCKGNLFWFFRM
jgi:hypothetical protein